VALLQRQTPENVTARLTLRYQPEHDYPLHALALQLWGSAGAGRIEPVEDAQGDYLAAIWEDPQTRYVLRLGNGAVPLVDFTMEDRSAGNDLAQRAERAAAFDRQERDARFAARKLLCRIPRSIEIAKIQLGTPRDRVLAALAERDDTTHTEIRDGLAVTFTGDPDRKTPYLARQMFIRFNETREVIELRVRYQDGPASQGVGTWSRDLLAGWQKKCGAGLKTSAPWAAASADLPVRKPAATLYRWVDDATVLTCQYDGAGAEVTLRTCSATQAEGVPLKALEFLPRGSDGYALGDTREQALVSARTGKPSTTSDGGLILPAAKNSPYDMIIVWFDNDRAVRIVGHHAREGSIPTPEQLADKVLKLWQAQSAKLGWPRRQDESSQKVLQGLAWQDDRTRVRHFWEKPGGSSPQVYTEWKDISSR
jgi:hypothetical protein